MGITGEGNGWTRIGGMLLAVDSPHVGLLAAPYVTMRAGMGACAPFVMPAPTYASDAYSMEAI